MGATKYKWHIPRSWNRPTWLNQVIDDDGGQSIMTMGEFYELHDMWWGCGAREGGLVVDMALRTHVLGVGLLVWSIHTHVDSCVFVGVECVDLVDCIVSPLMYLFEHVEVNVTLCCWCCLGTMCNLSLGIYWALILYLFSYDGCLCIGHIGVFSICGICVMESRRRPALAISDLRVYNYYDR